MRRRGVRETAREGPLAPASHEPHGAGGFWSSRSRFGGIRDGPTDALGELVVGLVALERGDPHALGEHRPRPPAAGLCCYNDVWHPLPPLFRPRLVDDELSPHPLSARASRCRW